MKKTRIIAFLLFASLLAMTGCSGTAESSVEEPTTEAATEEVTEEVTEEETEPPTNAPFPEADPNAVTFDNAGAEIASVFADDELAVDGIMEVVNVDGNNMLRLTDTTTTAENIYGRVQKVRIDITRLLSQEQLEIVDRIDFDVCAEAKDTVFVNDDGETPKVPGWLGGGGGTETSDGKWYGFKDFSASNIQEYALERSDMYHVSFKFLLAASGRKWDSTMTEPYLQIMRWGMQNISDLYIDNITFYDADGNSIPLTLSEGWGTGEEGAEVNEEAPEEAPESAEEAPAEESAEESVEDTTEETTEEAAE